MAFYSELREKIGVFFLAKRKDGVLFLAKRKDGVLFLDERTGGVLCFIVIDLKVSPRNIIL